MAFVDEENILRVKLVYYGPALSGKTTNVVELHNIVSPDAKGEIMVLETDGDRTLFFDAFPLGMKAPGGMKIKIKLYTVPGQVEHDSTRKALLSRADGVVFVADLQKNQQVNNGQSFENLMHNLQVLGMDPVSVPLVVQFNKTDLPDIMDTEALLQKWSETPWAQLQFASALNGRGVLETFRELTKKVYQRLDDEFSLSRAQGLPMADFMRGVTGERVEEAS